MDESKIKAEIWEVVLELNRAWALEGNTDKLKNYFHKDMVAITATDRNRLEGIDACIASWKEFVDSARINYFKEREPGIQIYGSGTFAIVTYYYDMCFEKDGRTVKTGGRDMFALVREDEKWMVAANQFSLFPQ